MSSANYEDIDSVTDRYKTAVDVDDDLQQEPPIAGTKMLMTTQNDGLMIELARRRVQLVEKMMNLTTQTMLWLRNMTCRWRN